MRVGNRPVFIDFDTGAAKKSFKQKDGQHWTKIAPEAKRAKFRARSARPAGRG